MGSIIDEITAAEKSADDLRQKAVSDAREAIADADKEILKQLADTREKNREALIRAQEKAEADGRDIAADIMKQRASEAEAQCAEAANKLPDAVKYLVEKVVESK